MLLKTGYDRKNVVKYWKTAVRYIIEMVFFSKSEIFKNLCIKLVKYQVTKVLSLKL